MVQIVSKTVQGGVMNRGISRMCVLLVVVLLVLVTVPFAQVQKDSRSGLDRVEGLVRSIDKDASTISIQQAGTVKAIWTISYNKDTKFTYRNSASTIDEVKDGRRVICLGKAEGTAKFAAARVDVRTKQ
jgi:hypothetical protein